MNDEFKKTMSVEAGRMIAEAEAKKILGPFAGTSKNVLAESFVEADKCWMFFRNPEIEIPDYACLGIKWAYVVSKKGTFSMVQDLSSNRESLREYIQKLSDRFAERNE